MKIWIVLAGRKIRFWIMKYPLQLGMCEKSIWPPQPGRKCIQPLGHYGHCKDYFGVIQ